MGLFPFKKKVPNFFTEEEKLAIVQTIRQAETSTSGEIRLFVESSTKFVDAIDRAKELFFKLEMDETEHRNGVLVYVAMKDHQLALFADEGIYKALSPAFWNEAVTEMLADFKGNHIVDGLQKCINKIGQVLTEKFPYEAETDKNELPDDIVFGN